MTRDLEVAVIGAGPIGLIFSIELAKQGYLSTVFEEDKTIGRPCHCAGILSVSGLSRLGIKPKNCVENRLRGAVIYSPSGKYSIYVKREEYQAYVVNREKFDQYLYDVAVSQDVRVLTNSKVLRVRFKTDGSWRLETRDRNYRSKVLVNAEGAGRNIVKQLLGDNIKQKIIPALQYDVRGAKDLEVDTTEIYLGSNWSNGFFVWITPLDDDRARVGLATRGNPLEYMKHFMSKHPIASRKLSRAKIEKTYGGRIIISGDIGRFSGNGFLILGDAAGHTKPTTGGGVIIGGLSAKLASRLVADALSDNNIGRLKLYSGIWRREFGRNMRCMLYLRRFLNSLSDKEVEKLIQILEDYEDLIEKYGEIDEQKEVIIKLALRPKLLFKIAPLIIKNLLKILH